MTGFVALAGTLSGARPKFSALLTGSGDRDETLDVAFADDRLTFLMTADLACLRDPGDASVSVGDVLGAFSNVEESLAARRRRSLADFLNAERAANGWAPPYADEYHVLTWRPAEGQLEARHDWAGVKPLYFIKKADGVVIASALRFIVELSEQLELDEGSLRRFVVGRQPAPGRTCYRDVGRLPPGHKLRWDGNALIARACARGLDFPTRQAPSPPVEEFRTGFRAAVVNRIGSKSESAALLSGGLDSSSISVVARDAIPQSQALNTLSLVFDQTPEWSERRYIEAVAATPAIDATIFSVDDYEPFAEIDRLQAQQGGLFLAPGLTLTDRLFGLAERDGRKILLDGHGGDEVVSHGFAYYQDLASKGAWRLLLREIKLRPKYGKENSYFVLAMLALNFGRLRKVGLLIARLHRRLRRLARRQGAAQYTFPLLASDQRERLWVEMKETRNLFSPPPHASREQVEHYTTLTDANQAAAFEILHAASSAQGVSLRFPFWARNLVEFCLTVKSEDKVRDGYSRWILREAMTSLPDLVRWRRDKLDFSPHLAQGLARQITLIETHLAPGSALATYVDLEEAGRLVRDLKRYGVRTSGFTLQALWRLGALGHWLAHRNLQAGG